MSADTEHRKLAAIILPGTVVSPTSVVNGDF